MVEKLHFIFNVCVGVGIAVPLLNLLFVFLGSIISFDFNLSGDTNIDGFVPLNPMCLCFSLVVFGSIGSISESLMINLFFTILILILLIGISAAAYFLLYNLVVKPLKKNNPAVLTQLDLLGKIGKLTLRVTDKSDGVVSVLDSTGAMISYKVRASDDVINKFDGLIPQGTEVVIIDVDTLKNVCYIEPLQVKEKLNESI